MSVAEQISPCARHYAEALGFAAALPVLALHGRPAEHSVAADTECSMNGRATEQAAEPDAAGALDRLDYALAAFALAEAGARLLGQPAAPAWRRRAEERFDAAERAGATDAALTALLGEHGQVT